MPRAWFCLVSVARARKDGMSGKVNLPRFGYDFTGIHDA